MYTPSVHKAAKERFESLLHTSTCPDRIVAPAGWTVYFGPHLRPGVGCVWIRGREIVAFRDPDLAGRLHWRLDTVDLVAVPTFQDLVDEQVLPEGLKPDPVRLFNACELAPVFSGDPSIYNAISLYFCTDRPHGSHPLSGGLSDLMCLSSEVAQIRRQIVDSVRDPESGDLPS